ncbi:MAG TPA: ArsB/NhaD family transporter [Dongiaceae bacterium]|jgi:Na+/H+ antiporter NhaD/arsenite permease-like protein|nr:ArsB/NhaD family transporter [Dongiaceae bacterium]
MEEAATGHVLFGLDPLWVSTALLIATYAAIMTEKLNRAIVALMGAGLMISLGLLNQEQAVEGIDFNTLALLTGMMLIVAIARRCGIFQYVAIVSAKAARANPAGILVMLAVVTAVVSALLDNVTTVLLIAPVTLVICRELQVKPYAFLFAEIFASNIGGTATLIGDPPNIIIGSAADLSFMDFVNALAPIIVIILLVNSLAIHLIWGRSMKASADAKARVMALDHRDAITDRPLMRKSIAVIALVIAAFVLARLLHLEAGTIALFGAAILLMLDNLGRSVEDQHHRLIESFNEVEWITIFFFVGLFIVVAGVEHAGLLKMLADWLVSVTKGDLWLMGVSILWVSAVLSAIIDNIPFVATMIPVIKNMAPTFGGDQALLPLWWALSLGACLGGNGTLIGASANLTVAGIGERAGVPFRFVEFAKIAFPLMLISIAISHAYLAWRYL